MNPFTLWKRAFWGAARLLHRTTNGFWTLLLWRAESAEQKRIRDLLDRIEEQGRQIQWLREDVVAKDRQVQLLVDVVNRDRERVRAETAAYSRQVREATSSPQFNLHERNLQR